MHASVLRLVAAAGLLLAATAPARAQSGLGETPCRLALDPLPAAFASCARLRLPLDHAQPDGPALELFFARIPALTAAPADDPLVLLNGGPGGSAVDLYLQLRGAFEPIRRERDILLLDQRGTGRSLSGLDCELPEDFELVTTSPEEIRASVVSCIAEFEHDPRFFTTSVAVRDLESLRERLGIEQWNLYGVSYGTRVAQHYLKRYPERVRALILDGVVPAELALGPSIAGDAERALAAIFARCRADAACAARYPDLPGQFAALRERFAEGAVELMLPDPVSGTPKSVSLGTSELQGVVRLMSYNDATVALLPLLLDQAYRGNYLPLAGAAELQIAALEESIGFAMHNSVICTEDVPWFPPETDADAALLYLGTTVVEGLRAICEAWPAGVIDADFKTPVASARPALLLSGEHDPVTPPDYAEAVIAGGLSQARHLIGPAQGHGLAGVGCVPELMRDFIESAEPLALDADCLDREPPLPFFLNFRGPAP